MRRISNNQEPRPDQTCLLQENHWMNRPLEKYATATTIDWKLQQGKLQQGNYENGIILVLRGNQEDQHSCHLIPWPISIDTILSSASKASHVFRYPVCRCFNSVVTCGTMCYFQTWHKLEFEGVNVVLCRLKIDFLPRDIFLLFWDNFLLFPVVLVYSDCYFCVVKMFF